MCNSCDDKSPRHLDDSIDDLFGGTGEPVAQTAKLVEPRIAPTPPATPQDFAAAALGNAIAEKAGPATFKETCAKCRGSGRFTSFTGRDCGPCFTCDGKGYQLRKTSPEARQQAADRKAAKAAEKMQAWLDAHPAETEWMKAAAARGFNFAADMLVTILKYGDLNEFKLTKVREFMAKDAAREQQKAEVAANAPDIKAESLDRIMIAFDKAIEHDVKRPKMRLDAFLFSLVRTGQNAGAIYVKSAAKDEDGERRYLGKIAEGRFHRAFKCSDEEQAAIVAAASDPEAAAIAYGRREGACSICGLKLTNHVSIDRGIGPICATKFGW